MILFAIIKLTTLSYQLKFENFIAIFEDMLYIGFLGAKLNEFQSFKEIILSNPIISD